MKEDLVDKIHASQRASERSNQTEIGASELGDCRRKVWYRWNNEPITNHDTLSLAAFMGTAIHHAIEKLYEADGSVRTEVEVASRGLKGHVDLIKDENKITDWKTITKKNVSYFGSQQQRWQIHSYGLMANDNGIKVDTVQLVGLCRDGNENDIVQITEPYDETVALEALAWLEDVKVQTKAPAPEKDSFFCKDYCPFFGACAGRTIDSDEMVIDDFDISYAAREYLALADEIKELELKQAGAKAILEGVRGTTVDGIRVSWTQVAGRKTIDEQAVLAALGEVPRKQGEPSTRLSVKR